MKLLELFKKLYIISSGYSYTHLGRMFLRMFVGIMLIQFGVRHIVMYDQILPLYPEVMGISPSVGLWLLTFFEIFCSFCIMVGFCTRLMIVPPFIIMCLAENFSLHLYPAVPSYMLTWTQPGFLPIMFLGIYFFLFLVGPGKISFDYFLALHIIHTEDKSEEELEEV